MEMTFFGAFLFLTGVSFFQKFGIDYVKDIMVDLKTIFIESEGFPFHDLKSYLLKNFLLYSVKNFTDFKKGIMQVILDQVVN